MHKIPGRSRSSLNPKLNKPLAAYFAAASAARSKSAFLNLFLVLTFLTALGFAASAFASSPKERIIYAFQGGTDGAVPWGGVLPVAGKFYGVTSAGGGSNCQPQAECGTVFELAPASAGQWTESVIYVFKGKAFNDGNTPSGGLVADRLGNLYGTTYYGGSGNCVLVGILAGCGTIFELSPPRISGGSWTETILYSFQGGNDSYVPRDVLIFDQAGNLYGVSQFGGSGTTDCDGYYQGCGTVFKLTPPTQKNGAWTETVLYAFTGQQDGGRPFKVVARQGALYGTTFCGGLVPCVDINTSCGTVFQLQPPKVNGSAWSENVLYSFANQPDGCEPAASVIFDSSGNLYGTAGAGGTNFNGIIFELSPPVSQGGSWTETIIDNIQKGQYPAGTLAFDKTGNLYGTTELIGTVLELQHSSAGWTEVILHSFRAIGTSDGFWPTDRLTMDGKGNLYGTTLVGGGSVNCSGGCGSVYEVIP